MSVLNRTRNRSNKKPYLAIYDNITIHINAMEMKNTSPTSSTHGRTSLAVPSMSNFAKTHTGKRNNTMLKEPLKGLPVINTENELEPDEESQEMVCETCRKRELRRLKKPFRVMEEVDYTFDPSWHQP